MEYIMTTTWEEHRKELNFTPEEEEIIRREKKLIYEQAKVSPWDFSEYLDDEELVQVYLQYAYESGDPKNIAKALDNVARARERYGLTVDVNYTSDS